MSTRTTTKPPNDVPSHSRSLASAIAIINQYFERKGATLRVALMWLSPTARLREHVRMEAPRGTSEQKNQF